MCLKCVPLVFRRSLGSSFDIIIIIIIIQGLKLTKSQILVAKSSRLHCVVSGLAKQNMSPQYVHVCIKKSQKMANDIEGMEL